MENKQPFRSGFVAILGRPNVGKSSIMNRFVGEKVAIVSNHPQTTRSRLLGVATRADWQIVFVDTPGLHKPRTKLGQYMVKAANDAREGVDAVLCVVDGQFIGAGDRAILEDVAKMACPKFLGFDQIVCVSARRGDRMDELLSMLVSAMPEGPKYFPDDMMTDQPERVLCAEIIREKALWNLRDEVPHGVGVEMLSIKETRPGLTEIHANIYCERASHKSIIIGRQGAMLGKIGSEARRDIEKLLDTHVSLKLWVKVREDWRNRAGDLRALGYEDE